MAGDVGLEVGQAVRLRLLLELDDPPLPVDLQDAEAGGLLGRHREDRHRGVGHVAPVRLRHLAEVHLVELVAREDEHLAAAVAAQVPHALPDRVGRALEPLGAVVGLLGGERRDEGRAEDVELVGHRQVLVEALRVVLGQHEDAAQVRVEAVADRDVDQAVLAGDRHRGLRALAREREEPGPAPAPEDDGEAVVHDAAILPRRRATSVKVQMTLVGSPRWRTSSLPVARRSPCAPRPGRGTCPRASASS